MRRLSAVYGQRRRQVIVVAVMGFFGVVLASLTAMHLPEYVGSVTASDAEMLYLVAQSRPLQKLPDRFFMTFSADGEVFAPASTHSGRVMSVAAHQGRLYCLLGGGSLVALPVENWAYVPPQLDWPILGIAVVRDRLTAFGQTRDHTKILTAELDNVTWRPAAAFDYTGDNIVFVQGVHAAGEDVLVWTEFSGGDAKVERELHLARITADRLEPLPSRTFDRPFGMTAVGDDEGVHVFFQDLAGAAERPADLDDHIRVVSLLGSDWTEPRRLDPAPRRWMHTGDFTAARFRGRTFLYMFRYWFGHIYAGLYGAELRGDGLSDEFLVRPPQSEDLALELAWTFAAVFAAFIAAGGLAGLARLRSFESQRTPLADHPIYATVTDRAAAAAFDFALVYLVVERVMTGAGPAAFWGTFLAVFAAYGTALERWLAGQTLGKKLLGLRVLSEAGSPVSFVTALGRNLFKFIEMVTVGVGVCLVTRRFQRPGDLLAGTVVVKELRIVRPAGK